MNRNIAIGLAMSMGMFNTAQAAGVGDVVVNVGFLHLAPRSVGDPFEVTAMGNTMTIPDSTSRIHNVNSGIATLNYFFTDHISAETALAFPPTVHLDGEGSMAGLGELGSAKLIAPVILVKYHFGENGAAFRPAIGLGVTYVRFSDIQLTPVMATGNFLISPTLGRALTGATSAKLDSTVSPVLNAGLNYNFNSHWSVGAALSYTPIKGKATLSTNAAVGAVTTTEKFKMDTIESFLSAGYTF